mmetsp:Transcript_31672/g.101502  ORF Transcript_31672/g.101502 Transcript_31672/m.101502 type:complete len:429 (-) Transcript_31672:1100-2386(-)
MPLAKDMVAAYLKVPIPANAQTRVVTNLRGITGRNGDAIVLGTELYGTHTSGPNFDKAKRATQASQGWIVVHHTEPDWVRKEVDGVFLDLLTYADDMRALSPNGPDCPLLAKEMAAIHKDFPLQEADATAFVGYHIEYELAKRQILMHVIPFIEETAKALDVLGLPKTKLPFRQTLEHSYGGNSADDYCTAAQGKYYLQAVGCLAWMVREQMPALKVFHQRLAQYQAKPTKKWLAALKSCLKFVYDHRHELLWTHTKEPMDSTLTVYVDASHNDELDFCGTTIGSVTFHDGACLTARSKKKKTIMSAGTAGNEARALSEPLNESLRYHEVLMAAGFTFKQPLRVVSDNVALLIIITGGQMTPMCRTLKPKLLRAPQLYAPESLCSDMWNPSTTMRTLRPRRPSRQSGSGTMFAPYRTGSPPWSRSTGS